MNAGIQGATGNYNKQMLCPQEIPTPIGLLRLHKKLFFHAQTISHSHRKGEDQFAFNLLEKEASFLSYEILNAPKYDTNWLIHKTPT